MGTKEYMKAWHAAHPEKAAEYRHASKMKRGAEYWSEALKRSRAKDPEETRYKWRLGNSLRRARLANARITDKYIIKKNIINWESRICGICNLIIEGDYHLDHIVPLSKGGEHSLVNLQLTHPFCNRSKGSKLT